jgi:hypothetical protein
MDWHLALGIIGFVALLAVAIFAMRQGRNIKPSDDGNHLGPGGGGQP